MKKVLIIAFFWPYCSGSKRVIALAKCLPQWGWQPIILTGPLDRKPDPQFRVIETDQTGLLGPWAKFFGLDQHKDVGDQLQQRFGSISSTCKAPLRSLYNIFREMVAYPDEYKGWASYALKAASIAIKKDEIDAIISIWPVTGHIVAQKLRQKYAIPWIGDFPDLWSQNAAYGYSALRQFFDRKMEVKTLQEADIITTPSEIYKERLHRLHGEKKIHSVTFGFDPDTLNTPPARTTEKLTITYTGMFYGKKRNPSKFFQALASLTSEGSISPDDLQVRFYGPSNEKVEKEIKARNLSPFVEQCGPIPLQECLEKQRESQLLLQLNWEDKSDKGVFSGKMLDYLAALRPILAVGGGGGDIVEKWLQDTNAGAYCPEVEDARTALYQFYLEYKQNGNIQYKGNIEKVEKYSSKRMAREFAEILNQAVEDL